LRGILPNEVQAKFKLEKYFLGAFQAAAEHSSKSYQTLLAAPLATLPL